MSDITNESKPVVSIHPNSRNTNKSKNYTFDNESKEYVCNHISCGKRYKLVDSVLKHRLIHSPGEYKCSYEDCNAIFKVKRCLNQHQVKHTDKYLCDVICCGYRAECNSKLSKHKRIHSDDKLFKCDIDDCNKAYKHIKDLQSHRLTAHSTKSKKKNWIQCPEEFCDFQTKYKFELSDHMWSHKKKKSDYRKLK